MGINEATASRLIKQWGTTAQYVIEGERTPDGGGGYSAPFTTSQDVTIFEGRHLETEKQTGGGMFGMNAKAILLSLEGLNITPTTNDYLRIGGLIYPIDKKEPVRSKGNPLFWILEVTRVAS